MIITHTDFGRTRTGEPVIKYTLTNNAGNYISLLNYGATIQSIVIKDKDGRQTDVCLGYDTVAEYENSKEYFGACIGRVSNRIEDSRFVLNNRVYSLAANNGRNHLHGGPKGFDKCIFDVEAVPDGLCFKRLSPDMEEGYPGNLQISVTYSFDDDNRLTIRYHAVCDKDTPAAFTNHAYFNLNGAGSGDILDHRLTIHAGRFTENTDECLPNGRIRPVEHTPMDFKKPKAVGQDIFKDDIQLKNVGGYDHNFIPDGSGFRKAAALISDKTGIKMEVYSDMPGIQLYTGNFINEQAGKNGTHYGPFSGLALETQYYPNAMAHKHFPSIVLKAGDTYTSETCYQFRY